MFTTANELAIAFLGVIIAIILGLFAYGYGKYRERRDTHPAQNPTVYTTMFGEQF